MISYKIIVQNTVDVKNPEQRVIAKPGQPDFKQVVFTRNLKQCRYKTGDRVKVRGTAKRGNIVEILTDINVVNWVRNRPHYIVAQWDDGSTSVCNHSQLKVSKI
jgi:hypothetical protein